MQYTKVTFSYAFEQDYLEDILLQGLGDLGFETFDGMEAYIQTEFFLQEALNQYLFEFNAQYGTIVSVVSVEDVPDENWNATWEAEHPMEELPDGVRIVPHCAFGAGHHETTGMMIDALRQTDLTGKTVLDQGCGTGVLGIFAKKRGAAAVVAVDIDDKSVSNTLENAELNDVSLDVRLGSQVPEGQYDLIIANIHRNILLAMMADFGRCIKAGGQLWLSGFYEDDILPLTEAATQHGFALLAKHERGEWRMIELQKNE